MFGVTVEMSMPSSAMAGLSETTGNHLGSADVVDTHE